MYTIVLVIKKNTYNESENNIERFMKIGMKTYEKYLNTDEIYEFIVITPDNELEYISKTITTEYPINKWKWNFISEDKLIDTKIPSGWGRQQTSKLAISFFIKTKEYLIIDDDTFLTKNFNYKNMFIDNKLILNKTDIDFPFFFLWSSQILEVDYDIVQYYKCHMGITPQIFITDITKNLVKYLITKYGNDKIWQLTLVNNKFTEYTLYWIWLIKNNIVDIHYNINTAIQLYGNPITEDTNNLIESIHNIYRNNNNYYFSFIQSSLSIKIDDIKNEIKI